MTGREYFDVLIYWFRSRLLKARGVRLAPGYRLGRGVEARLGERQDKTGRINIDVSCKLETGVILDAYGGSIELGSHVFVGPYTAIYGHGGVSIGNDCLIAMHCRILSSNHTVPPWGTAIRTEPDILLPTRIGHDVWLGAGVTVLGGVSIGYGCVVGAGSVVTKDLPPGTIAYGVPAEPKGVRAVSASSA